MVEDIRIAQAAQRDKLYKEIAELAWLRLGSQYQFPEEHRNSQILRTGILVAPDSAKGESLVITEKNEKMTGDKILRYLVIRLMMDSLALNASVVSATLAFDTDEEGKFKNLNTALSEPQQMYFDIAQLEALLEAVTNWPNQNSD